MKLEIGPSLLAADFSNIAAEVRRAEEAGADFLHLDVMDGHFVPNFSMGPSMVAAVRRITSLPLEVHLMIYNPFGFIERFAEAGANRILFHLEATEDVEETLQYIRRCGLQAGLAVNPETSTNLILRYLEQCHQVLLMTVNPGFGGQPFLPEVVEKITYLREICEKLRIGEEGKVYAEGEAYRPYRIEVDGGIDASTAALCRDAGANMLVAGTYLFRGGDMAGKIRGMRKE